MKIKTEEPVNQLSFGNMRFGDDFMFDVDEDKLLKGIDNYNFNQHSNFTNFRNECIELICFSASTEFFRKFMKLLYHKDLKFFEENKEFFNFLYYLQDWRENGYDSNETEKLLENVSRFYFIYKDNEFLLNRVKFITQVSNVKPHNLNFLNKHFSFHQDIIERILQTHGSSAVVRIKNLLEKISYETQDYEILFILWRKLFERYLIQSRAHRLCKNHNYIIYSFFKSNSSQHWK